MDILKAVLMGFIQGITEFLPVSSSGHLGLIKGLFGMESESILFDVLLHFATLIAIVAVFYKDVFKLVLEFIGICRDVFYNIAAFGRSLSGGKSPEYVRVISSAYRKFVLLLIISTVPTGIIGVLMKNIVEFTSGNLLVTGICLICTGLILFLSDFLADGEKKLKEMNNGDAFAIGTAQGIATLPGLSRSGVTIVAGVLCGLDRKFAAKYSFIMSIPAVFGALILELFDLGGENITGGDVGCYVLGMVIAAVIGYFALKFLMNIVVNRYFKFFAYYCAGIGLISIITFIVKKLI
ncbi:MAG: undecaprenyl-diphosphate phosphatase [Lachnospiraceae bacterium]|nr:undecaprenyl-diphosphate phosphatase [Lachnospiraceae bacterium]